MTILNAPRARARMLRRLTKAQDEVMLLRALLADAMLQAPNMRIQTIVAQADVALNLAGRDLAAAQNYIMSLGDRPL